MIVEVGALFILGLVVGSFLGVVVDRVPKGASIVQPPSACSQCGRRLGPLDLVPVFSYIVQRGKCRFCGASIPQRDLVIEIATGLLFIAIYALDPDWRALAAGGVFAMFLMVMFLIDLEHMRLPNSVNAVGLGAALILVALGWTEVSLIEALAGTAIGGGVILLVIWLSKGGMGVGDAKFLAVIGAFLGPLGALYTLFAGSFMGASVGIILMKLGRHERRKPIPFGPFLSLGAAVVWTFIRIRGN